MRLQLGCGVLFFLFSAAHLFAQNSFWQESENIDRLLLKKDLAQAVKEAENSARNDASSLVRRLNLSYRIADNRKIAQLVRQIADAPDFAGKRGDVAESVKRAVKDDLFTDVETLRLYLQKIAFDDEIYGKFAKLCVENQNVCDVKSFDEWLARKAVDALENSAPFADEWTDRRIGWRARFGLDNSEIFDRFAVAVRENPANLDAALRYARFFPRSAEISWLAETFASQRSYDYYELGEVLAGGVDFPPRDENQRQQILRVAVRFLRRSLDLPFQESDKTSIVERRFRFVQIAPRIGNYEKQLRFWTKTKLAETFQKLNEPHNAQPIVEELAALDKSDIQSGNSEYLAGAVQSASGARVVESKILREQGARQNSYEYWHERVNYYRGRQEPERVFDAFRQSFAAVPLDLSDERSRDSRLYFIGRFADFVDDEFGGDAAHEKTEDLSDEEKRKLRFRREAEDFLRGEYEKTNANAAYSAELVRIISNEKFEKLLDETFKRDPQMLVAFAQINAFDALQSVLDAFMRSASVTKAQKAAAMNRILTIAASADVENALTFIQTVIGRERSGIDASRIVPLLLRNLEKIEKRLSGARLIDEEEKYEAENLRDKYLARLFETYLQANDRRAAEKLIAAGENFSISDRIRRLVVNAAENGALGEAMRFWKLKANLNRRDLDDLETLARRPEIKQSLKEFYQSMKISETFSPIPDIALRRLK